jgi:RNA-directed DNA polymerase
MSDKRQKNQLVLAFQEESRSEAPMASEGGTESLAAERKTESPAIGERLMEDVGEQENCKQALARVKANKGSPGVNRMTVHDLPGQLHTGQLSGTTDAWNLCAERPGRNP